MDTELDWLQKWYWRHCDGDWEHCYGITIETMDNPGWSVKIDLNETELEREGLEPVSMHRGKHNWLECSVADSRFQGYCSPTNLSVLLGIFGSWARTHHEQLDIFIAVAHHDIESIELIIAESPEQIDKRDGDWYGCTPLHHAVANGDLELAELLLKNHANGDSTDPLTGWNPILAAVSDASMVTLLLRYGASVSVTDKQGRTPLHWAAADDSDAGSEAVARLLLEHGAHPNAVDAAGNTPLHIAIASANGNIVRCLMSWGADPTLPNAEGITPRQSALAHGFSLDD